MVYNKIVFTQNLLVHKIQYLELITTFIYETHIICWANYGVCSCCLSACRPGHPLVTKNNLYLSSLKDILDSLSSAKHRAADLCNSGLSEYVKMHNARSLSSFNVCSLTSSGCKHQQHTSLRHHVYD